MPQGPDKNSSAVTRTGALLTGILVFAALLILDAWDIAPHSAFRAGIVGGVSAIVAMLLIRLFHNRKRP
ncbi:hypothetical protein ACQR50_01470 [Sphingomonas sp. Xoc002]|uniref:hypothetical protein n=1 Tax=Sphingomonas sp. Xoc002 TaxID=2837624 RepID=UPI003D16D58F